MGVLALWGWKDLGSFPYQSARYYSGPFSRPRLNGWNFSPIQPQHPFIRHALRIHPDSTFSFSPYSKADRWHGRSILPGIFLSCYFLPEVNNVPYFWHLSVVLLHFRTLKRPSIRSRVAAVCTSNTLNISKAHWRGPVRGGRFPAFHGNIFIFPTFRSFFLIFRFPRLLIVFCCFSGFPQLLKRVFRFPQLFKRVFRFPQLF